MVWRDLIHKYGLFQEMAPPGMDHFDPGSTLPPLHGTAGGDYDFDRVRNGLFMYQRL